MFLRPWKRYSVLALIFLLLLIGYAVCWVLLGFYFQSKINEELAALKVRGHHIEYSSLDFIGFPFTPQFVFKELKLVKSKNNKFLPEIEVLVLWINPFFSNRFEYDLSNVKLFRQVSSKKSGKWVFFGEKINGAAKFKNGKIDYLISGIKKFYAQNDNKNPIFKVREFNFEGINFSSISPIVAFGIKDIRLTPDIKLVLGQKIEQVKFEGRILGKIDLPLDRKGVSLWVNKKGAIETKLFFLNYSGLKIRLNGTLSLNENLQPMGKFSAEILDAFNAIDTFREQGKIKSSDMLFIKLALSALSLNSAENDEPNIKLLITVKDNEVYLNSFKIFKLKKLDW